MAPSATATQAIPSKIKRPVPPGIQTNGVNSSTSSPSPSMSASRLPSATKYPPNSTTNNGTGGNNSGPRSANRTRRESQRNSSVGLRSGSIVGNSLAVQPAEPQPYIITDEYILKRYRGNPPSLIIHLHPTHFRFDQQEGSFTYKSPMRIVIEHLRQRTIPHDLVEFMDVPFYEGCMIVQIYDHKSSASPESASQLDAGSGKAIPFSVHNFNETLTPSSYVPYALKPEISAKRKGSGDIEDPVKLKNDESKDKENISAPAVPKEISRSKTSSQSKRVKVSTIVLHPTPLSDRAEFVHRASETVSSNEIRKDLRQDGGPLSATIPPTPSTAVPSTPLTSMAPPAKRLKKGKVELDSTNIYATDSQITFATTAPLVLDTVDSAIESATLLKALTHPMHDEKPPLPKTRKRTVAEMAADQALAADQERYMLILDERLSSNSAGAPGANNTDGDGQVGGASFEPRFERFKTLENIKNNHEENKRLEKLRREEAERKAAQDRDRDRLRIEAEKREREKAQTMQNAQAQQQLLARQQQHHQESQRRAQMVAQAQQGMQGQHAHPQANNMIPNSMQGQPQRFHQQQASQAPVSSPIIRNGTPQSHSSPMAGGMNNAPMQHSTSSMGGSPARPGSVVQQNHPPMGAPTSHGMTAQRSQQSHAGTPRMPNSTPNIQSTPLNRQMSQTPRMSQGSPLQGAMAQVPQMPMLPNGQPMQMSPQQQQQLMQQQRLAAMQRQQLAQSMSSGMMNGQQLTPQQILQVQMARQQQQQQQQQGMQMNPMAQNYAAQIAAMAARNAAVPQNMNQQQFMNQQMSMQQAAQAQMQMRQAQMQAHAQQQQHPQQMNPQQQQINQIARNIYTQKVAELRSRGQFQGGIPEEADRQLKSQSHTQAQQQYQMRRNQMMQQQQAAQNNIQNASGIQGGMHNGMGM